MDNSTRLQLLFDKYLQRRCSPQELEELIGYLQQGEADQVLSGSMQAVWDQLKEERASYDVDWEDMYSTIRATRDMRAGKRPFLLRHGYAMAASILLLMVAGIFWQMNKKTTAVTPRIKQAEPKQAATARRQTIHLPDGSTVVLNANSRLNYPPIFSGATREVFLIGEGYFDIKHNPKQPFLVHTGRITTKVLGTSFNIKAYNDDAVIEVTVTKGKVQVLKDNKPVGLITVSQQIAYSNNTETVAQKTVDVTPVIAWKPEEIYFNDITLEEALKQISDRFAMQAVFNNTAVKACRVTATFSGDDLPDEMLAVICAVSGSTYTINGNKITIDGKGCQ